MYTNSVSVENVITELIWKHGVYGDNVNIATNEIYEMSLSVSFASEDQIAHPLTVMCNQDVAEKKSSHF